MPCHISSSLSSAWAPAWRGTFISRCICSNTCNGGSGGSAASCLLSTAAPDKVGDQAVQQHHPAKACASPQEHRHHLHHAACLPHVPHDGCTMCSTSQPRPMPLRDLVCLCCASPECGESRPDALLLLRLCGVYLTLSHHHAIPAKAERDERPAPLWATVHAYAACKSVKPNWPFCAPGSHSTWSQD